MITKVDNKITDLVEILSKNRSWNLARKKFLAFFICSITKLQTVCFVKIAQDLNPDVKHGSNLRRIQRFFSEFILDHDIIAKLLFSLLPPQTQYKLCLDRTNWKYGKADINILVLSACYEGLAIPLLWKMLPKMGNSNTEERKELLRNYIRLFGTNTIHSLIADREFIGDDWFDNLIFSKVPFYICIRNNMYVDVPGKGIKKAFWLFNDLPLNTAKIKKHGRKAYSFFKYGLIALAKALLSNDYQLFGNYLKFLSST